MLIVVYLLYLYFLCYEVVLLFELISTNCKIKFVCLFISLYFFAWFEFLTCIWLDLDTKFFWKWTDFQSYVDFMLLFGFIGAVIMYLLIDVQIFVESVGLLALLTEAMLGLPQFIRNLRNKSTEGMRYSIIVCFKYIYTYLQCKFIFFSMAMVAMWTIGDSFKTCYFIIRNAPLQFGMCGTLQIMIDLAILLQVYIYRNNLLVVRPASRVD